MKWRFGSSRKSSISTGGESDSSGTTTPTEGDSHEIGKSTSRLRRLTGGRRSQTPKPKKSLPFDEYAHLNKPFTRQNLEHQKILCAFEWNSAKRRSSHSGESFMSNISPCASRKGSVDHGYT